MCHEKHTADFSSAWVNALGLELFVTLALHKGDEVCNSALHDTCALDDLRQEHLSCPKQISNNAHACNINTLATHTGRDSNGSRTSHERTLNDVEWLGVKGSVLSCLLSVLNHKLVNALDKAVLEALLDALVAPLVGLLLLLGALTVRLCIRKENLRRLRVLHSSK